MHTTGQIMPTSSHFAAIIESVFTLLILDDTVPQAPWPSYARMGTSLGYC